jgi:ubiquinone/menaquinone biosynthesis C-methylase UbiE
MATTQQPQSEVPTDRPTPDKVMRFVTGGWATSIVGAAARHGIFNCVEEGQATAAEIAKKTRISLRGAQALLDGLTGLGLLTLSSGLYGNSPDASAFLVKGKSGYIGGMAEVFMDDLTTWQKLPEAAKTGLPVAPYTNEVADNAFWHVLVPAIAALSVPVAQVAAERLGLAKAGPVSWLDVGGGSGVWSAVWLGANPQAKGVQLDWPHVNEIARKFVANFGVTQGFHTIDGDFHSTDFGTAQYEFAVYSHLAHQETPEDNTTIFRKFRQALKPGGTLVINDFVLNDDRTGNPFAMMFSAQMLVVTQGGSAYRQRDYRDWLGQAGFGSVEILQPPGPSTVVLAR